ncbi:MAG: pyridoxal phosphate-dependent aminotransferase [Rhodobacter sp.]|nr:pyridoxal phosphate-dependent aminotransferase [Rhodobacter sp.]
MKNGQTLEKPVVATAARQAFRRSPTLALVDEMEAARQRGQDVLSLSTPSFPRGLDVPMAPLANGMRLSAPEGDPELRTAARAGLFGRWVLPDHDLCITAGAKAAMFAILRVVGEPGARIIVMAPAWPSYDDIIQLAGHLPVPLWTRAEDGFRLDPADLTRLLAETGARAVMLANPGNPTGQIASAAELDGALAACVAAGALLVLDESFSEIIADHPAWAASVAGPHPNLVIINSFSKNHHLQGQRIAACLLHASLRDDFVAVHQALMSSAPSLGQAAALAALQAGALADYSASRAVAVDLITRAGWSCLPNQGTFYHFPRLPDPAQTLGQLRDVGLYGLSGDVFGAPYASHLRLCFGRPKAEMAEILKRVDAAGLLGKS